MAVAPVSSSSSTTAQSAYGLNFQSLLQIVLEELTYQDPLNPVSNYEFVSQLGQFSQLQLSQTLDTDMTQLLTAQAAMQATGLIGQTVDVSASDGSTVSGQVTAVAFANGQPSLTIETTSGQTVGNLSLANVVQVQASGS